MSARIPNIHSIKQNKRWIEEYVGREILTGAWKLLSKSRQILQIT